MYKIIDNSELGVPSTIKKSDSDYFIPLDVNNYDFRKVAQDLAEFGPSIIEGDIPEFLQTYANKVREENLVALYKFAKERLDQYRLSAGREEKTIKAKRISGVDKDGIYTYEDTEVTIAAIDPLPTMIEISVEDENHVVTKKMIDNPVVVKDEEERAAAQAIIDATPQDIIDLINAQG